MSVLEVTGLKTHFFTKAGVVKAVDGVDLFVDQGEILGLVGESGSGKSITGFSILGLVDEPGRIVEGSIRFKGEELVGADPERMRALRGTGIAMIFQDPMMTLNPVLRVDTQMIEALKAHERMSDKAARARCIEVLGQVGIPSPAQRLEAYPHQFSGGMRQRVAIAIALLHRPSLIVAHEPTTALDVTIQAQILHLLAELQRELHMGLVLITHDLGIVARIATRVVVMYAGEVVESGPAEQIFNAPSHPYTRGLLECIPIPGRTERGGKLGTITGMVPSLVGHIQGCHFADRCPHVIDTCRAGAVPLTEGARPEHHVRCIRSSELPTVLPNAAGANA